MPYQRKYDFIPGTKISSSQVDDEFNNLIDGVNTLESNIGNLTPADVGAVSQTDFNNEKQLIWSDMAKYQIPKLTDDLGNAIELQGGRNFNTVTNTGWYRINSNVNSPPKSVNNPADWWYLEVIRHADSWIIQKAYDFLGGTYIRRFHGGTTWDGWVRIGDEQNAFTRMQRWNAYTLPANAWARLTWETKVFDDPGLYVVNENTFLIPYSGWYRFDLSLLTYVAANTDFYAELWKIGSSYKDAMINHRATNTSNYNFTGLASVWANAGDKFEIVVKQTDSFTKNLLTAFLEIKREG